MAYIRSQTLVKLGQNFLFNWAWTTDHQHFTNAELYIQRTVFLRWKKWESINTELQEKKVDDHINTIYFCRFSYLLLSIFYLKIIDSFEIMRSSETTNYTFFITKQLCLLKYNLDYIQQHTRGRS